jgi:competence protein ComGC
MKIVVFFILIIASCFGMGDQITKKSCIGVVTNVTTGQITVQAYDLDKGAYQDKIYLINKDTQLKNINSLTEIVSGNRVSIEYYIKNDKNNMVSVFLEKTTEEEKIFQDTAIDKQDTLEEYTPEELKSPEKPQ